MSITELKDEIYKALESTSDKQVLKIINELLQSRQEEIVGYSGDAPITKSDLYKRAIEAEQDWKDGKIFTVDEVREKFRVRRNDGEKGIKKLSFKKYPFKNLANHLY